MKNDVLSLSKLSDQCSMAHRQYEYACEILVEEVSKYAPWADDLGCGYVYGTSLCFSSDGTAVPVNDVLELINSGVEITREVFEEHGI